MDSQQDKEIWIFLSHSIKDFAKIGYPGGTLFVARCKAKGYGTNKDLDDALNYYYDYIRTCGSNENIDKEIAAIKREKGEPET